MKQKTKPKSLLEHVQDELEGGFKIDLLHDILPKRQRMVIYLSPSQAKEMIKKYPDLFR